MCTRGECEGVCARESVKVCVCVQGERVEGVCVQGESVKVCVCVQGESVKVCVCKGRV